MKKLVAASLITSFTLMMGVLNVKLAKAAFVGVSCTTTGNGVNYMGMSYASCSGSLTSGNFNPTEATNFLNGTGGITATDFQGNTISGPIFGGISNWTYDKKINTPGTVENGSNILGFDITPTNGATSGTWGFSNTGVYNIVLELKAANNGLSYYYWDNIAGKNSLAGVWDTVGLAANSNNGRSPGLSHASLFWSETTPTSGPPITAVPEPSSILGTVLFLGASSYAFYRKRRKEKHETLA